MYCKTVNRTVNLAGVKKGSVVLVEAYEDEIDKLPCKIGSCTYTVEVGRVDPDCIVAGYYFRGLHAYVDNNYIVASIIRVISL